MTIQHDDSDRDQAQAMPPGTMPGVLRRMLAARHRMERDQGKPPGLPKAAPVTPARAAATACGRVADRLYGLAVRPLAVEPGAMTLAELPELLPERALLAVLQGPGDCIGTLALCPEVVAALVEVQALGRVTARPVERRRPTRSESMLCTDFVDALMAELQSALQGLPGFQHVPRMRFATALDDPRPLSLMLEDRPFRSIAFHLTLGGTETREGRMLLVMPQPEDSVSEPVRERMVERVAAPAEPAPPPAETMPDIPVELVGILCRRTVTLGELRGLGAGKLLHLPRVRLADARVETLQGQLVASGKFGEYEGCHAIRLQDPDAPEAEGGAAQPDLAAGPLSDALALPPVPGLDPGYAEDPFRPEPASAIPIPLPVGRVAG